MASLTLSTAIIAKEAVRLMKGGGVSVVERDAARRQAMVSFDGPPPYMRLDEYSSDVLAPMMGALAADIGYVAAADPVPQMPAGIDGYVAQVDGLCVRVISMVVLSGKLHMRADVMGYA